MISVQNTDPQRIEFLTEIFSSSTKLNSIITTILQLTKNDFTGRIKQHKITA